MRSLRLPEDLRDPRADEELLDQVADDRPDRARDAEHNPVVGTSRFLTEEPLRDPPRAG